MMLRRLLPSLFLFLVGCAGAQQGYPSLGKRAAEGAPVARPVTPPPPAMADAPLIAEIGRYAAQAQAGKVVFDAAYGGADRAVRASGSAAVSSDAWVAAQVAISALESARNDSVSALASLDTLFVERTNAVADGKAGGGVAEIDAARATALAIVDDQNDRIDALKDRLPQP